MKRLLWAGWLILICFATSVFAKVYSRTDLELLNSNIKLVLNKNFHARVYVYNNGSWQLLTKAQPFTYFLEVKGHKLDHFKLENSSNGQFISSVYGESKYLEVSYSTDDSKLKLNYRFFIPRKFPNTIICNASIDNLSGDNVNLICYDALNFNLDAKNFHADSSYNFWSFQGGSYIERYDWIFPITKNYFRENYQGMNAPDYGGGIPVVDLWTQQQGIAFASLAKKAMLISLPVKVEEDGIVSFSLKDSNQIVIDAHQKFNEIPYAIILHHGDYFNGLRTYSDLMKCEGFSFPKAPSDAYQPEWCAWGYERHFNKEEILKTLPEVKKLGFEWATLDDGWQNTDGDWEPNPNKFPGGEKDFISFINKVHSYGLKVRLWWVPFVAQDSSYSVKHYPDRINEYGMKTQSNIALEHPDWFILDKNGNRIQVSWWNSYLLCPALPQVRDYYIAFLKKAILKWKIDGFKMDGQNLNEVPRCYNTLHHHESPLASTQGIPGFFKGIYDEAMKLKPNFVLQACPCGTNFSIYNLPYVNQTVASDPLSSWQVRLKGKTFRALYGNNETYSGDHVELTNHIWDDSLQRFIVRGMPDFASALAIGGVPSSKFTIGGFSQPDSSLVLDSAKQIYYARWMKIYNNERMSEGKYLNLYDIAYDKPETHLIKKRDNYYYTFFSNNPFDGIVELRGLGKGKYKVIDLFTGKLLDLVSSQGSAGDKNRINKLDERKHVSNLNLRNPQIKIHFGHYLLIKAEKLKR